MNIAISLTILTIGILIGRIISHFMYLSDMEKHYYTLEQIQFKANGTLNEPNRAATEIAAEKIVKLCSEGKE